MNAAPEFNIEVQLSGQEGNVFTIIGRVSRALKRAGEPDAAKAFTLAAFDCASYGDVLSLAARTVVVR